MEEKGFTLIELVVVSGIIIVLVAIVVGGYVRILDTVQEKACWGNLRVMDGELIIYNFDKGVFPPVENGKNISELEPYLVPDFLKRMPECPQNGEYTYVNDGIDTHIKCSIHGELPK